MSALTALSALRSTATAHIRPQEPTMSKSTARRRSAALLAVIAGSLLVAHPAGTVLPASAVPAAVTPAAVTAVAEPAAAAVTVAPDGTGTIHLCAKAGGTTLAGTAVNIWGYAPGDCTDPATAPTLPGPVLELTDAGPATVVLHNALAHNVSLVFPGQAMAPDTIGAAPGASATYTFTPKVGTHLYESGVNVAIQVPMGLHGAMVVKPAAATALAYPGAPGTAYTSEKVLVLSEVDTALNNSATPNTFNPANYAPKYWLINGAAYPATGDIPAAPGDRVLLRYVNAGLENHTLTLLGARQLAVAMDANVLANPLSLVAPTLPSGQTWDMIVDVPVGADGVRFPLYNRQMRLTNGAGGVFPGGMLTFIAVSQ
jgi:FtsP/CotA-like multicopper oxidase with cupredoxin domain